MHRTHARTATLLALALLPGCIPPGIFVPRDIAHLPATSRVIVEEGEDTTEVQLTQSFAPLPDVELAAGSRIRYEDGMIASIRTAQPLVYSGLAVPAESTLYFDSSISDFGQRRNEFRRRLRLGGAAEIQGVAFGAGDIVELDEGLRPRFAQLEDGREVGGTYYDAGTSLTFNRLGEVTSVETREQRERRIARQAALAEACRVRCAPYEGLAQTRCFDTCR